MDSMEVQMANYKFFYRPTKSVDKLMKIPHSTLKSLNKQHKAINAAHVKKLQGVLTALVVALIKEGIEPNTAEGQKVYDEKSKDIMLINEKEREMAIKTMHAANNVILIDTEATGQAKIDQDKFIESVRTESPILKS